jgi:hypothetical protein
MTGLPKGVEETSKERQGAEGEGDRGVFINGGKIRVRLA